MHDPTSDLSLGCASIAAFAPGTLDVNPAAHLFFIAVTARKPGTVIVDGVDVDYRNGVRSGHQRVGDRMRVTVNSR